MLLRHQTVPHHFLSGVGFMLLSALCIALATLIGKQLTLSLLLPLMVFLRFFLPGLLLTVILLWQRRFPQRIHQLRFHLLRVIFTVSCQYAFFYYLAYGSILNATLLFMTSHLFVPLISRVIYKKAINRRGWISLAVGFCGVVLILQPGSDVLSWPMLVGLIAGLLNAGSQLTQHKQSKGRDEATTVTLSMFAFSSLLSLLLLLPLLAFYPAPWSEQIVSLTHINVWPLFILFAFTSIGNQLFRSCAYHYVNKAASLSPFAYSAILFSALADWWVYHQVPNLWTGLGALLIVCSAMIKLTGLAHKVQMPG
ncbi:MAG: DMT family transporter [Gammaproteobacteria bacterium]|nr:DMT family transporter [Gammaproteobacteria bacterium]